MDGSKQYAVRKLAKGTEFTVSVPGSKSITNRALMLAALSDRECLIQGVLFSDDSLAFLECLNVLGFPLFVNTEKNCVSIRGYGGRIPIRRATLNVRSAGTAARFLTVMLAAAGGEYTMTSSAQMEKRPMEPLLSELRRAGVTIECLKEEGHFPFIIRSTGLRAREVTIDTTVSSQFASALLMAAVMTDGLKIHLTGTRTDGAYIGITAKMMQDFGIAFTRSGNTYEVPRTKSFGVDYYRVEPDVSAACYFYALAAITNGKATVEGVHFSSMQGDVEFLRLLCRMGCTACDGEEGITLTGAEKMAGVAVNMREFSDQALTLAAIAPFLDSPTEITGIGHIRKQECDRINAIRVNLEAMGCKVEERADSVTVYPAETKPCVVRTFDDHRVAMAFTVAGLCTGKMTVENPDCCKKTFVDYFKTVDSLFAGEEECSERK